MNIQPSVQFGKMVIRTASFKKHVTNSDVATNLIAELKKSRQEFKLQIDELESKGLDLEFEVMPIRTLSAGKSADEIIERAIKSVDIFSRYPDETKAKPGFVNHMIENLNFILKSSELALVAKIIDKSINKPIAANVYTLNGLLDNSDPVRDTIKYASGPQIIGSKTGNLQVGPMSKDQFIKMTALSSRGQVNLYGPQKVLTD